MHARVIIAICVLLAIASALAMTQAPSTNEATTTTTTRPTLSPIPQGYTYSPATGSYYKLHKSGATWDEANTTCAGEGAHLVVLNDAEEADIVAGIMRDAGYYYIRTGLRDNRPGGVMDWRTVHGEPLSDVYNVWGVREPTNKPQYTCAVISGDKRLHDEPCDWSRYFTCEISQ